MSRLGRCQGCIHRRPVAHLADEEDIRILTQGLADAICKRRKMRSQFALCNQGSLSLFDIFNRVLQGNDMTGTPFIDELQDAPERRRLAAARRAANQDQAAMQRTESFQKGLIIIRRQRFQRIEETDDSVQAGVFPTDMKAAAQASLPGKGTITALPFRPTDVT